jgi:hypothetical protein
MRGRMFGAFFVAALLFRLGVATLVGAFHWFGRSEVEVIALNFVQTGDYSLYGVPSAYATPVFPLFLAGMFSVFGTGVLEKIVTVTLACAASALCCALLPLFLFDAGFDRRVALLAGGLSTLYIGSLETQIDGNVEGPYVAVALLVLIWAALRMWRDGWWQARTPWWLYAFCGFCALLNPNLIPVTVGLLLAGAIACPAAARRRYLRQAALAVLGILVFLAPWGVSNYLRLGAPILTRSNFGTEFWVSNGPGRTFDHPNNYHKFHPSQNNAEAARVADLGEVEYNRIKLAEGLAWVRSHPGEFARCTAQRIAAWWFPPHPPLVLAPKAVLTLAAFAGLWLMFRSHRLVAWLLAITWITFPAVYFLVHWSSRYRAPMEWQLLLSASVALVAAYRAVARPQKDATVQVPAAV